MTEHDELVKRLRYGASPAGISEHVALLLAAAGAIESLSGQLELYRHSVRQNTKEKMVDL
jgi:hypothetical protein